MTEEARSKVFVDNERVRVTEWRFAPGASTGWHRHGHDYVVIPLMDGKMRVVTADGDVVSDMKSGSPYFRPAGTEHDVINAGESEYAFIEVELK